MKALIAIVIVVVIYMYYRSKEQDKKDMYDQYSQQKKRQTFKQKKPTFSSNNETNQRVKDIFNHGYDTKAEADMKRNRANLKKYQPKPYEFNSLASFDTAFHDFKMVGNVGNLFLAPADSELIDGGYRTYGAMITLDSNLIHQHKNLIRDGIVTRDSSLRYAANVAGFDNVASQKIDLGNGEKVALWHRTHYIPFRFALSEGDIRNIMFTGTAHLNHGDRPDEGYYVDENEARRRQDLLFHQFHPEHSKITKPVQIVGLSTLVGNNAPKDTQYSLDDMERLAESIIQYKKGDVFRYGVMAHYNDDNMGLIPDFVEVRLVNVTKGITELSASLQNRF